MTQIKLDRKHHENLSAIEKWCHEQIGPGARRFVKNTWLGSDDWFYYEERVERDIPEEELQDGKQQHVDASDDIESDLIFVFRRENDATVFSLKWQ